MNRCPVRFCTMQYCPYGKELDARNCETCTCRGRPGPFPFPLTEDYCNVRSFRFLPRTVAILFLCIQLSKTKSEWYSGSKIEPSGSQPNSRAGACRLEPFSALQIEDGSVLSLAVTGKVWSEPEVCSSVPLHVPFQGCLHQQMCQQILYVFHYQVDLWFFLI